MAGYDFQPDPDVDTTPEGFVARLQALPELTTSDPEPVTVGGLSGLRVDVSWSGQGTDCDIAPYGGFFPVVVGLTPTSIQHGVSPDYSLQLTLLANGEDVLLIEAGDGLNGGSDIDDWWAAAEQVQSTFRFA